MFFHAQHDSLCTTDALRRAKLNSGKKLPNMSYIGDLSSCESFLDRIPIDKLNNEEANTLRVVHVALKSRKMKTLRDFQERRYGTAPTVSPPTTGISNVPSSTCLDLKLHTFKVRKKSSLPEVKFQTLPEPLLNKNI